MKRPNLIRLTTLGLAAVLTAGLLLFLEASLTAGPFWDRLRGCTSEGLVRNETDVKSLAQYKLMRDKIKERNRRRPRAKIVITGDSIAAYFQPQWLAKYLPGRDVANRGIPGDTTYRLLNRLQSDVLALHPETIIVSIGGNDLLGGRCPDKVLENTRLILTLILKERPGTNIILTSLPPTALDRANKMIPDYNEELQDLARDFNGTRFINLWPLLVDRSGKAIDQRFQADSIHINEQGYRLWADQLLPLLRR